MVIFSEDVSHRSKSSHYPLVPMSIFSSFAKAFKEEPLNKETIFDHMIDTYFWLRIALGAVAVLFPVVMVVIGMVTSTCDALVCTENSISEYFFVDAAKAVFIAILVFEGALLMIYKGYSNQENTALNFAGLFLWGVAAFPTTEGTDPMTWISWMHIVWAVSFFACVIYVAFWKSGETLGHLDKETANRYWGLYRAIGILMVVLPFVAVFIVKSMGMDSMVFWVEAVAIWVFGLYWFVKSRELRKSSLKDLLERLEEKELV